MLLCDFDGDHFGAALFHLEREKTTGGTNLQNAFASELDLSQVVVHSGAQVPLPVYDAVTGEFHGVVKIAVSDVVHLYWLSKNLVAASIF